MRFLSMLIAAEDQGPAPQALQDAMDTLIADSFASGTLIQTGGLGSSARGFTVRAADGKLSVVDGPFAETKEVVGGYAVLEHATREDAIEAALSFMRLHTEHWPGWHGECRVRSIEFLAP